MATVTQKREGEANHRFFMWKEFRSINTQPSREAVPEQDFAWIENLMPIGNAYMPAVAQAGASIATITQTISHIHTANIGTTNYGITFAKNSACIAINMATGAKTTIAPAGTFTSNHGIDQWKSERVVIADAGGMYSWDGTLFYSPGSIATVSVTVGGSGYTATPTVSVTGAGGSGVTAVAVLSGGSVVRVNLNAVGSGFTGSTTVSFSGGGGTGTTASAWIMPSGMSGSAIAVYQGRVWVGNDRLLSYTAPNTWYDVNAADAAGSTVITEGYLRQRITALEALDNYLYVFGDSSSFVIGDLKVTGAITTFSFTNLSPTTGTTFPDTIQSMERAILFMNRYGVYALFGASLQKVSRALDGIFPLIDFSDNVSGGLVQVFNIQCYAINFLYQDPTGPSRWIQALFFDGKWFLTSQGTGMQFIAPMEVNGALNLYGTTGTDFRQLYSDTTSTIATTLITALSNQGDSIRDKQLNRIGLEYTAPTNATISVTIDTENRSQALQTSALSEFDWVNNNYNFVNWTNTASVTVQWVGSGFRLFQNYSDIIGKYIGMTITSNSPQIVLNGMLGEYQFRATW